jgi:glyoxylate reductase
MSNPRVFVTRRLPGDALSVLAARTQMDLWPGEMPPPRDEMIRHARDCEGILTLVTDPVNRALLEQAPKLRVVSNMAVGYDNIDVAACTERGVAVGNTPGVLTDATADLAFALLLAAARRLPEAREFVLAGRWKTWDPSLLLGRDVHGATLGIFGMGQIGQAMAKRARGFGMRIVYSDKPKPSVEEQLGVVRLEKDELLREADFVSLHVPLSPKTRHLIGAPELAKMKPTAVLINTSRGAVVDPIALAEALRAGRPGAAALDVTDPEPISPTDPLLKLPNALVVPHIGSASVQSRTKMASLAVENLLAGLEGRPLPHSVNPQVVSKRQP